MTNLTAWLSGVWFELSLLGGAGEQFVRYLPFANAVDAGRAALTGDWGAMAGKLCIVIAWALMLGAATAAAFQRRMRAA